MARLIVLDASVLIAYLRDEDAHHRQAHNLVRVAIRDEVGVNSLTLGEVLVVPARQGRLADIWEALHELGVQELPFPDDAAERLAVLRAETGLRMPDCCVLLAAESAEPPTDGSAVSVATFDSRLAAAARTRGLAVLPDDGS